MKKRIFGALLALCMILAFMPSMAFAADDAKLIVDGVDLMTAPNHQITCSGGGTAAYDPASRTLTLNNAIITKHSPGTIDAGIYIDEFGGPFTVKLIGENKILFEDKCLGIIKTTGDSALNIVAGREETDKDSLEIVGYAKENTTESPFGIQNRGGDVAIGRIKLSISLKENSRPYGNAIEAAGSVTLDGTVLNVSDYTVGVSAATLLSINNVDFTADSVKENAILVYPGSAEIKNSKIIVQDTTDYSSVWVDGDLAVIDSEVRVHSKYENGIGCGGELTVSGGKLNAIADEYPAVYGGNGISVQNGAEITAAAQKSKAISARKILNVENGKIKATSGDGIYPIYVKKTDFSDSDTKPADDTELIKLGKDITALGGVTVLTTDWEYVEDFVNDEKVVCWLREAYFDTDATEITVDTAYTVTYAPGANGTGSASTAVKNKGVDLVLQGALFTRDGYTQIGWAAAENATAAEYGLGAKYNLDASITLYPVWRDDRTGSEAAPADTGLAGSTTSEAKSPKTGDVAGRNLTLLFIVSGSVFAIAWLCVRKKTED